DIESIAFPLIATGAYGFPKTDALLIATSAFSAFLTEHELDITLVVFDGESFELSGKIFRDIDELIDERYVEEQFECEYGMPLGAAPEEVSEEACEDRNLRKPRRRFLGVDRNMLRMDECAAPASAMAAAKASHKRSLDDVVKNVSETWSVSLLRLIDEKGYTDVEVYKRANVDRKLFSKIRTNKDYKPRKNTAVAFALALKLNVDETKDFIGRAGYAFSPSDKFDLIVQYFIDNEVYDMMTINLALFEHGQPQLGE
ncbi:MAG: RNase III inhibitor, partial [Clostridiales bacterium]|nr:RNase III inhibitor [Clostridiales bacterium]